MREGLPRELCCSFCGLPRSRVGRLIAGPNVYICDGCVEAMDEAARLRAANAGEVARLVADGRARCSFCNKSQHEVERLWQGPDVRICNECLELCNDIVFDPRDEGEGWCAPASDRYQTMIYRRAGASGLNLPAIALGCWHNFGGNGDRQEMRRMLRVAFDLGISHLDLANNYGPPPGSAEENVGVLLGLDFARHRDELVVSTKAGYGMWSGPYGDWGSKKYLVASLDQSLKRLGLGYVDIFYHHRPDPRTPPEETIGALDLIVRQGKALYAGISNYDAVQTAAACDVAESIGLRLLVNQVSYSMLNRWIERDLLDVTAARGLGVVAFCPLAQGLLTSKYLTGVPEVSRAADPDGFLKAEAVTPELQAKLRRLNELATARGQSLAQMALAWVLRDERVTCALIGARTAEQVEENVAALTAAQFGTEELAAIEAVLSG